MRTIKYRGKVEGNWWHVKPDYGGWEQFWSLANESTIGQFTGLTDKDGKEIYEDDVVRWEGMGTHIQIVRWVNDEAMFLPNHMQGDVEVIGNIHDNPELVGGKP